MKSQVKYLMISLSLLFVLSLTVYRMSTDSSKKEDKIAQTEQESNHYTFRLDLFHTR